MIYFCVLCVSAFCVNQEYRLLQDLLRQYDVNARPVDNPSQVINVRMGVSLFQILDLVSLWQTVTIAHVSAS